MTSPHGSVEIGEHGVESSTLSVTVKTALWKPGAVAVTVPV
jgi:hypothetical protein